MPDPQRKVVAAFDFDGTLTRRDTLLPFLAHVAGRLRWTRHLAALAPTLLRYAAGGLFNHAAKERVLQRFLAGRCAADLMELGRQYAVLALPHRIRPRALARLRWHQAQGHRCILVSASLDLYLVPWAAQAGIDDVVASSLEVDAAGLVSGRLKDANCYGSEKARRLAALLGPRMGYTLHAYGDSRGDRELLAMADYAHYRGMPCSNSS